MWTSQRLLLWWFKLSRGAQNNDPVLPPTFGDLNYRNYKEQGVLSRYGYNDYRKSYGESSSTFPS